MADARGVPRGNYDDPVHDVISMTKSVPSTPLTRGPPCPKTLGGTRNLHQSGFTLAGRTAHSPISAALTRTDSFNKCLLFFRSSGRRPHTTPLHPEDCSTPWWPIQHHVVIVNGPLLPFVFNCAKTTDSNAKLFFKLSLTLLGLT